MNRFLQREAEQRKIDGLSAGISYHPPGWLFDDYSSAESVDSEWEIALGIDKRRRLDAINWILDVSHFP